MIEVKNLSKRYGKHTAIKNLSFTIDKGQIYGFLGPNGAGKTTTMNIITGYIAPTDGNVLINGFDIYKQPEKAKKFIGYLPEIPPLYPEMKVFEYLIFCAKLKGIENKLRIKAVEEVIKLTKLEEVEKRLIKNISKGFQQRVGLAQALIGMPEIIILDEPTVGLDPKQIIEIRDLIKSLRKNHTIILSSHILQEVSAVCDHIMIITNGELIASDTTENLTKLMVVDSFLEIQVKGDKGKVNEILKENKQIIEYELTEIQSDLMEIRIKSKADVELREELSYSFVENRCPILSMQSSTMSLEEIFLELTDERGVKTC